MALVNCPDCGREVSDMAPACLHCGRPQPGDRPPAPLPEEPQPSAFPPDFLVRICGGLLMAAGLALLIAGKPSYAGGCLLLGIVGMLSGMIWGWIASGD